MLIVQVFPLKSSVRKHPVKQTAVHLLNHTHTHISSVLQRVELHFKALPGFPCAGQTGCRTECTNTQAVSDVKVWSSLKVGLRVVVVGGGVLKTI